MLFVYAILLSFILAVSGKNDTCESKSVVPVNGCINFSVGQGTGCQWMCEYCASQLGTASYYFTTDVCKYQTGGCVGNLQPGVTYTCCSSQRKYKKFNSFITPFIVSSPINDETQ